MSGRANTTKTCLKGSSSNIKITDGNRGSQLDPESTNLDLIVCSTSTFDISTFS